MAVSVVIALVALMACWFFLGCLWGSRSLQPSFEPMELIKSQPVDGRPPTDEEWVEWADANLSPEQAARMRHAVDASSGEEASPPDEDGRWHVMHSETLMDLLWRAHRGESPDVLYIEEWLAAERYYDGGAA